MAIKIKIENGTIPEKCFDLLVAYKEHKDECIFCTMAEMNQLDFKCYCKDGRAIIKELSEQPEVSAV
jgi:hypothetical protein